MEVELELRTKRRGEVVIRRRPAPEGGTAGASEMPPADSVKPVAGLPGETLEIREGVALGAGEYFLLGDARHISRDSRSWGPVRRAEIDGRVVLVVFPWERFGVVR